MESKPKKTGKWVLVLPSIVLYFVLLVIISRFRRGEALGVVLLVAALSAAVLLLCVIRWTSGGKKKTVQARTKIGSQKILCFGGACAAFLLLVSSTIWLFDFPKVDDVPYLVTMDESVGTYSDFLDTVSELDVIAEGALLIKAGEGLKLFSMPVSLREGDTFVVSFDGLNHSETNMELCVDLYTPDFDDAYCEFICVLTPGDNRIENVIPYGYRPHPEDCELRFFTFDAAELELRNLQIQRQVEVRQGNPLVQTAVGIAAALWILSAAYLILYAIVQQKKSFAYRRKALVGLRNFCTGDFPLYVIAATIVTVMLVAIYHGANIAYPLSYANGDEMGVYYFAKTIMNYGSGGLVNPMAGGVSGADFFDYILSEKFSFYILRLLGCFTSNPYFAVNLLYFVNYYLISLVGLFVCRKLGLRKFSSMVVSCLYAFSPFIQLRYAHMWLTSYYMVPLTCMIAVQIVNGGIRRTVERSVSLCENKSFWKSAILVFFCVFTGLYYAFFACAIFAVAIVIRLMNVKWKSKGLSKELYPILFIFIVICSVIVNITPNLLYYALHGSNPIGELATRPRGESEFYAMKLIQLLLPRPGHRIPIFRQLTELYAANYPLVNENITSSLGIISAGGFVLSVLFLFQKDAKDRIFSQLNIALFLIGTVGGIGSILSLVIKSPMRSYNRISVFIMFLSLVLIGRLLDRVKGRNNYAALCVGVLLIGLYDQTATYVPGDFSQFESDRNFIHQIESTLEADDMVFMLPYTNWPSGGAYRKHIGVLESESIHWSYGAMQGRPEAIWQEAVASKDVETMLRLLRDEGYDGIYLDAGLYSTIYGVEQEEKYLEEINALLGQSTSSEKQDLYFWNIRQ